MAVMWTYSEEWKGESIPLWRIEAIERLADGMVAVRHTDLTDRKIGQAVWSKSKCRKAAKCAATGARISVGDEVYRPIGNMSYRMKRILASVIDAAI